MRLMPVREENAAAEAFGVSASNAASRTRRVGAQRWDPYPPEQMNKNYSRMRIQAQTILLRMAATTGCDSAVCFMPRSGRRCTFSTSGTFVEALQIYDALERKSGRRQVFVQGDFVEAYEQFRREDGG